MKRHHSFFASRKLNILTDWNHWYYSTILPKKTHTQMIQKLRSIKTVMVHKWQNSLKVINFLCYFDSWNLFLPDIWTTQHRHERILRCKMVRSDASKCLKIITQRSKRRIKRERKFPQKEVWSITYDVLNQHDTISRVSAVTE